MDRNVNIEITLPKSLDELLEEMARSNEHSKNDEILARIEGSFDVIRSISAVQRMKRWLKMQEESSRKVLIVDDQVFVQAVVVGMLNKSGVEVMTASNGYEAVEHFDSAIGLVFMDYHMPEMNGVEATKAIRQKEKDFGSKNPAYIVGLTSDKSEKISDDYFDAGTDEVIEKPMRIEKLEKLLAILNSGN